MAVTDTGTLTELTNSEAINPMILDYAYAAAVAAPYVHTMDLRGKATKVGSFPKWILDTHTDITNETTALNNETLETTDVQVTAAEIGVRRDVSDAALEEIILSSEQLFDFLIKDVGVLFGIALDDDICALFPTLNGGTAVGTTKTNLTLANMVEAQATVRSNNMRGKLVYVLDDQQSLDYQSAQAASTATTVNSFFNVVNGIENNYLGEFMGHPVWSTTLCDTANTNEDVVGACFIDGMASPMAAAIGMVLTRDIKTELERDASARLTEFVATAKWGVGEISDQSGVPIVTDA